MADEDDYNSDDYEAAREAGANLRAEINQALGNAISEIVSKHESGFVIKWSAHIDTAAADGSHGLWLLCSEDSSVWDDGGMCLYAMQNAQAKFTAYRVHGL